jgi:UDP-N-acetylmuramoylalanine--D-glutamate ligase
VGGAQGDRPVLDHLDDARDRGVVDVEAEVTAVELAGAKVLVVGLGKSGIAAARLLAKQGARVIGNDQRDEAALGADAAALRGEGVELALGGHDAALFTSVDRIVISPGVPSLPALQAAERAGVPIASEIELASWFVRAPMLGITGTNGKSTVTTLLGQMCAASGRPTFVGGNLGTPLVDVVGTAAAEADGFVVVELSSFQLERVDALRVHVAALLNVTDDHLDRYPSFAAYADAKANVFHNQTADDHAVVPDGDALCRGLARRGRGRVHAYGGAQGEVRVVNDAIVDPVNGLQLPVSAVRMFGRHNLDNACAAALMARLAGIGRDAIEGVLRAFPGLPHRMVHVRTLAGVDYYDDSKATNVGATAAALDGLADRPGRVVLIAGGKDKGGDYAPVVTRMARQGRAAVLIGEATPLIARALAPTGMPVELAATLEAAVARARTLAQPGDVVLLAPACASFDMFRSYAHRGDVFQDAVRALPEAT